MAFITKKREEQRWRSHNSQPQSIPSGRNRMIVRQSRRADEWDSLEDPKVSHTVTATQSGNKLSRIYMYPEKTIFSISGPRKTESHM